MLDPDVLFQDDNFSTGELAKATEKLRHTHHTGKASIRLNMNAFKIYTQVSLSLLRFSISLYHGTTTRDGPADAGICSSCGLFAYARIC